MAIVYDPKALLKKIAPESKIKRMVSSRVTLKRAALNFVDATDFIDKKSVAKVALGVIDGYQDRIEKPLELTPEEMNSMQSYKGVDYGRVNGQLRGNKVQNPEKQKEIIKNLDSAIEKQVAKSDMTLYRGMYNVPEIRALGKDGIGTDISMPTYWSSSPDKATAEGFTLANTRNDGVLFEIKVKKGQNILDTTLGTKEKEFLLPRGQKYKVVGYKEGVDGGPPTYELEMIQDPVDPQEKSDEIKQSIKDDPKQLIQRVQNEVKFQVKNLIKEKYRGQLARWLPSGADEPRPLHQTAYGKTYTIGEGLPVGENGEMVEPGDEYGCDCGIEILVDETQLKLE